MKYTQKLSKATAKAHRTRARSFLIFISLFLISYFLFLAPVLAQQGIGQLGLEYGSATGLGTSDIRLTVARIIQVFLGLLGIVAVALVVYGGYLWMTSAGNEEKITQAKELLTNAGIGLVIILLAFGIVQFVVSRLIAATTGVGLGGGGGGGVTSISQLSNSLGSGIIREHYPGRDAHDIPRNVKVIVTFKDPISIPSIVKNYDDKGTPEDLSDDVAEKNSNGTPDPADDYFETKASAIQIYPSEGGRDDALTESQVRVDFTSDLKIWVFDPMPLLGSPSEKVFYSVELGGGTEGIHKTNSDIAFSGVYSDGYTWEFQVSTFVDTTPPKVTSVIPLKGRECGGGLCARNVIITMNFDEPIDPTSVSGVVPGFTNIRIDSNGDDEGGEVAGTFTIANQYRTVEFTPALRCGTNSCGGDVFCLPADSGITTTVRAATLGSEPPGAAFPYPFDGVTDVVGNSLNGNSSATNTIAEGPPTDNYLWTFGTSGLIDLTPPSIISIEPSPNTANVNADLPLSLVFSELMRTSTLSNEAVALRGANAAFQFDPAVTPWYGLWSQSLYWPSRTSVEDIPPEEIAEMSEPLVTASEIRHGTFMVNTSYYPEMTSRVQDLYQNCMFPPNQSAPESLQCDTTIDKPFCCFAPAGFTEEFGGGIVTETGEVVRGAACANPCVLGASGNAVCQE